MERVIRHQLLELSRLLNVFLAIGFLSLSVACLALTGSLLYALTHQRYTLVPPTISGAFTISQVTVDDAYLSMMSDYFLHLKFDVTPSNVHRQYGRLLDYVPEHMWSAVQPELLEDAQRIRQQHVSSHLDVLPDQTQIDVDSLLVRVSGTLAKAVGERQLPPRAVDVFIQMAYQQGTLSLLSIHQEESQ
ncbi:type IV conjugative transfer system protein TraE [Vibrio coralliilyticus]|uniref:type IV conjugative transfer system protein TraE n=1 Tax=Vibrio coralliilyticus TaxID=190893 RepID=UPI00148D8930|nr:type IV conjugative transfer system protein TraE [Vibrio coralliilyticus]NOI31467.1 type IV conjugative transfer system protein TraE [Vibrio coralliilyticus]NOI50887.1 type IV conjugative transfer system protein TraE [Vibrio coralliilyticus]